MLICTTIHIDIECELPPDIEQGSYTLSDGTEVGSVATYSCSFGFEFANINRQSLTCGKDGKWKGNVPICKGTCRVHVSPSHYIEIVLLRIYVTNLPMMCIKPCTMAFIVLS